MFFSLHPLPGLTVMVRCWRILHSLIHSFIIFHYFLHPISTIIIISFSFPSTRFDIYRKVPKDLTQPTVTGAVISILCVAFILLLLFLEFFHFLSGELWVDTSSVLFCLCYRLTINNPANSGYSASLGNLKLRSEIRVGKLMKPDSWFPDYWYATCTIIVLLFFLVCNVSNLYQGFLFNCLYTITTIITKVFPLWVNTSVCFVRSCYLSCCFRSFVIKIWIRRINNLY